MDRKLQSLAPLVPGTSNPAKSSLSFGGVARNIAENITRLGGSVSLYTLVGTDADGEALFKYCAGCGIDVDSSVRVKSANTGNYTAILDMNGDMLVAMADMSVYDAYVPSLLQSQWETLEQHSGIVADTNLPAETLATLLRLSSQSHVRLCIVPTSVPKILRLPADLEGIALLIANEGEIRALARQNPGGAESGIFADCLGIQKRGVRNLIVTQGGQSVFYFDCEGNSGEIKVDAVPVTDVTGAGDAFAAGVVFAANFCQAPLPQAIQLGIAVARRTVQSAKTVSEQVTPSLVAYWQNEKN